MKQRVEVRSQAEFDACVKIGNIAIVIGCRVVARDNASVVARGNASVEARDNASVEAWDNASVEAWGNASVVAWENASVVARGNASVEARGNASVVAWENASVVARGNASVVARDNASVEARDNASVEAWENASVVAWENASVVARENASVVARGNVFVRLFSCLKIKASAHVAIMRHVDAKGRVDGGRTLEAMAEPKTGAEWCEYWGIDPAAAPYKVENLDAKILEQIKARPDSFQMGSFHGDNCSPENWCNTTHCRAGFAICLAGQSGFDLERKFDPETAGKMIYAVSRPDKELPDFFCDNEEAMVDLEACAAVEA